MPQGLNTVSLSASESREFGSRKWIINTWADIFFLQSGAGLFLLPMLYFAYHAPGQWANIYLVWTLGFSLTHQSSTFLRLYLDEYCRRRLSYLNLLVPIALLSVLALLLYGLKALPVLASIWLVLQVWHVASQQYGINRRYLRMASSDPASLVNRLSSFIILTFPCLALAQALSLGNHTLFWYKLALPPAQFFSSMLPLATALFACLAAGYCFLELREWRLGRFVQGRLLCVLSTFSVNVIAWYLIGELSWAYVTLSFWHSLQYIVYADKFRRSPAPGVQQRSMGNLNYGAAVVVVSGLCYGLFQLTGFLGATALATLQLAFAFHHYLCDMLIWRRRNPA